MFFPGLKRCLATSSKTNASLDSIKAAILLTRQPILTPDLTDFESKYYSYQEELQRRLMWTFPQYYYFKKGSLSERKFVKAQRGPVSKQPGVFYEKGIPDVVHNRERRLKQDVVIPKDEYDESMSDISRPVIPNSRTTKADESNDLKSLERKLSRSLYLLIKDGKKGWKLPSFGLIENQLALHKTAEAGLRLLGGESISTWTVARSPAGLLKYKGDQLVSSDESDLTREYIIKSHILSGEFKPKNIEYAWLVREEIEDLVSKDYFNSTEFLFSRV